MACEVNSYAVKYLAVSYLTQTFISFAGPLSLKEVVTVLHTIYYKWFDIGIQLKVPYHKLMEFKAENDDESKRFAAVIDYWLKGNIADGFLTWEYLAKALRAVGENKLALILP